MSTNDSGGWPSVFKNKQTKKKRATRELASSTRATESRHNSTKQRHELELVCLLEKGDEIIPPVYNATRWGEGGI